MLDKVFHNWPAKVLSIAAAFLLFLFTNLGQLEQRYVTVPLDVRISEQMAAASTLPSTVRIGVRGDSDIISTLREEQFAAYTDLSDITESGNYQRPVQAELVGSASRLDSLELRVEPHELHVQLEPREKRRVDVVPELSGEPTFGYELKQTLLSPPAVEVYGPESIVTQLTSVRTESISLSARRDDFDIRVRLIRPNVFVRFAGADIVDVKGIVAPKIVRRDYSDVKIDIQSLDSRFTARLAESNGSVRLSGELLSFEQIDEADIRLLVDASSIEYPGTYTLSVQPAFAENMQALEYSPREVQIIVERSGGMR